MFLHFDSKKVGTLIKHAVTKFSVISSVRYTLAFITSSFFDKMFSQSRNFYEDNMVLSDLAKSGLESGAWVDEYAYQNNDKNITIAKK